jgi:hypothetical protein
MEAVGTDHLGGALDLAPNRRAPTLQQQNIPPLTAHFAEPLAGSHHPKAALRMERNSRDRCSAPPANPWESSLVSAPHHLRSFDLKHPPASYGCQATLGTSTRPTGFGTSG